MIPISFINLLLLAVMAVACAIADSTLEKRYYPLGAPWLFDDNQNDDNPSINGLITWAFALITYVVIYFHFAGVSHQYFRRFQNVVPISLYISIEVVRTCQAAFIFFDKEIWYAKTDQPTLARSWNLSDDLGQIEYIFSDKTGTLTQNSMVFRHCSIGGKVYRGEDIVDQDPKDVKPPDQVNVRLSASGSASDATSRPGSSNNVEENKEEPEIAQTPDPVNASGVELAEGVLTHFRSADLTKDLNDATYIDLSSESSSQSHMLNGFFSVLALCHTVLAAVDPETKKIEYRAQSPDEAALVQAAADAGFVFRGREKEVLRLQTPFSQEVELYELLNVLDFTSARKRMSVILRKMNDDNSKILLLTKGADNVIFERLKPGVNDELKEVTGEHLDQFASEGLRTLTLAYKVIPGKFCLRFGLRFLVNWRI